MSTTEEKKQTDFVGELLKGIEHVKSRDDGSVHTIKAEDGKTTVAEICHGKRATRLNFKSAVPKDMLVDGFELGGKASSWAGQGAKITDENLASAKQTLDNVVASIQPSGEDETPAEAEATSNEPTAQEAGEQSEASTAKRETARSRATRATRGKSRTRASAK